MESGLTTEDDYSHGELHRKDYQVALSSSVGSGAEKVGLEDNIVLNDGRVLKIPPGTKDMWSRNNQCGFDIHTPSDEVSCLNKATLSRDMGKKGNTSVTHPEFEMGLKSRSSTERDEENMDVEMSENFNKQAHSNIDTHPKTRLETTSSLIPGESLSWIHSTERTRTDDVIEDDHNQHSSQEHEERWKEIVNEVVRRAKVEIKDESLAVLLRNKAMYKAMPRSVTVSVADEKGAKSSVVSIEGSWSDVEVAVNVLEEAVCKQQQKLEKATNALEKIGSCNHGSNADERSTFLYSQTHEGSDEFFSGDRKTSSPRAAEIPVYQNIGVGESQQGFRRGMEETSISKTFSSIQNRRFSHYNEDIKDKTTTDTVGDMRNADRTARKKEVFTTDEGLDILIYNDDIIALANVYCIVNSTNNTLTHYSGSSAILSRAAGYEFQRECSSKYLETGKCVVTGAGRLNYQKVLHVCLGSWNLSQEKCLQNLKTAVPVVLETASKENLTSVAMSGIGTGTHRIPFKEWTTVVVNNIIKFSKEHKNGKIKLKEIHIVDNNMDLLRQLVSMFESTLKASLKTSETQAKTSKVKSFEQLMPFRCEVSPVCQLVINHADITTFCGNAIVITDDVSSINRSRLAKAVKSAAGPKYDEAGKLKSFHLDGDVVITDGGDLDFKYVFHVFKDKSNESLTEVVTKVLDEVVKMKVNLIALPAIFDATSETSILIEAMFNFITHDPQCKLAEVHFMDTDMVKLNQLYLNIVTRISRPEANLSAIRNVKKTKKI